jgi:hypothetical protein
MKNMGHDKRSHRLHERVTREIDELVYAPYGLTPEEIKIVEGQTK